MQTLLSSARHIMQTGVLLYLIFTMSLHAGEGKNEHADIPNGSFKKITAAGVPENWLSSKEQAVFDKIEGCISFANMSGDKKTFGVWSCDKIPASHNKVYNLSFRLKTINTSKTLAIQIMFFGKSNHLLSHKQQRILFTDNEPWSKKSITFSTPSNTAQMKIYIRAQVDLNGKILLDDFTLKALPTGHIAITIRNLKGKGLFSYINIKNIQSDFCERVKTNDSGVLSLASAEGEYTLEVQSPRIGKNGYYPQKKSITVAKNSHQQVTFTLKSIELNTK